MYHLKTNPDIPNTALLAREQTEKARQRLSDASDGLIFDPVPHKYYLAGRELRSVSAVVESFSPFDSVKMATRCSNNPKHELYGMPVEQILQTWERLASQASDAGTQVHEFGEACCLWMTGNADGINPAYRDRITAEGLAAVTPKEEAAARWWAEQDWTRLAVVAKETRIVNPALGYAGTFDLLLYDIRDAGFHTKDYKTNKDLNKWYGDMLLPPLNMIRANNIGEYTVQQTLYDIALDGIGLKIISSDLIWLRENGYETVGLDLRYRNVIDYAVKQQIQRQQCA